jgi:hypothetical protein
MVSLLDRFTVLGKMVGVKNNVYENIWKCRVPIKTKIFL